MIEPHKSYPLSCQGTWHGMDIKTWELFEKGRAHVRSHIAPNESGVYIFHADLVAEPDNPYSKSGHAISVRYDGKVIGYIPSEEKKILPAVARLAASGLDATVSARMWKSEYSDFSGISIALDNPDIAIPLNDPPTEGWALLPEGKTIQVTKEEQHFDVLQDYVPESGRGLLLVTLHKQEVGVRSKRTVIEVRIEGERIGELSTVSSAKLLPAVEHLDTLGLTTVSRAVITGSAIAAEMVLKVATAAYLDDSILDPEISPLPRLIAYEPNPDDYELPDRWLGQKGHTTKKPPKTTATFPTSVQEVSPQMDTEEPARTTDSQEPAPGLSFASPTPSAPSPVIPPNSELSFTPDAVQVFRRAMSAPRIGKKATPLQRGYTRMKTGAYLPGAFGPRIDGVHVNHCESLLQAFGQDSAPLAKLGWDTPLIWWLGMIAGFFLIAVPVLGFLLVIPWLTLFFGIIWHYVSKIWTKNPLQSPSGYQWSSSG